VSATYQELRPRTDKKNVYPDDLEPQAYEEIWSRFLFEFRHASWFDGDNRAETLDYLRQHRLPYVCVDMPQGHRSSVPPVLAATADLAVVRFHGHSERWTSKNIARCADPPAPRRVSRWAYG
jgi:uncharacterized protein YecE (DUF72 family)